MMRMTRILVKKTISIILFVELLIISTNIISYKFFINAQVAFLSSLFILLGSMYSYKRLVEKRVENGLYSEDRDELDKIDDPYDLYDEKEELQTEDIKAVIKEERKKLKGGNLKNTKIAASATMSFFRLVPYLFLVFGFIGLQNNKNLEILPYLLFLSVGLVTGYLVGKKIFNQ